MLGNHEIFSTSSDARNGRYDFYYRYASQADLNCFDRPKLFEPGKGLIASKVFAARPVVIQIGKFVFSHADVGMFAVSDTHFEFAKSAKSLGVWSESSLSFVPDTQQYTLEQLNNYVFDYMTCESSPTPNEPQNLDLFKINDAGTRKHIVTYTPKIQTIIGINGEMKSPLWERNICKDPFQSDSITSLDHNVSLKFVAGHSIQQNGFIKNTIRDNVWCVDTGMSEAFDGTGTQQPYSREQRAQSLEIIILISENPLTRVINPSLKNLKVTLIQNNKIHTISNNTNYIFGREFIDNTNNRISNQHFYLIVNWPKILIIDLSSNGTKIRFICDVTTPAIELIKYKMYKISVNTCIFVQPDLMLKLEWV